MSELIQRARDWLYDCGCPQETIDAHDDYEVWREVERIYEGGWDQFVTDG